MDVTIIIGKRAVRAVRYTHAFRGANGLDTQGYSTLDVQGYSTHWGVHWRCEQNIWLTPAQAGKLLGVSRRRARAVARAEGWNIKRVGRRNVMPLLSVLAYLATTGLDKGGV